jgi:carboxypeptidase Taq
MKKPLEVLKERLTEISYLASAAAVLNWDMETYMPKKGAAARGQSIAHLSSVVHTKVTSIDHDGVLSKLKKEVDAKKIKGKEAVIINETWRAYDRERKLPEEFIKKLAETTSRAHHIWAEARAKNDFNHFLPVLKEIVGLKRQEAKYVGYEDSPYDALLDTYEPGMTTKEAAQVLADLKDILVPLIKKIRASKEKIDDSVLYGNFLIDKQITFNKMLAERLGYSFDSGRLDASVHPFTTNFHPHDVRITTRYGEGYIMSSIGSTIHEAGHGLYEQGLPEKHFGTPLAEAVSLGIHESQSRLWENQIGKSREFWKYFYPKLQKEFPSFKKAPLEKFYRALNKVKPVAIRTDSDEVTYNLHIIVRFEIEKEMIEGTIDLQDLPKIWNQKMKDYLGLTIKKDSDGVLQDIHWSFGGIGYFPTYSLGNLYAAQLFATMKKGIPQLSRKISSGKFEEILGWLRKKIHARQDVHGARTYKEDQR